MIAFAFAIRIETPRRRRTAPRITRHRLGSREEGQTCDLCNPCWWHSFTNSEAEAAKNGTPASPATAELQVQAHTL